MSDTCTIIEALQERFSRLPSQCSPEQPMFDAQGREYLVVYRTLPTSLDGKEGAIASNLPNFQLNKDYLQDFQARDLSAIGESSKIRKIASKLDATRLLVASGDPTIGAPVVWTSPQGKSYVLGGNGRTIAFLLASDDRYKNYVKEASERWFNVYDKTQRKGYRNLLVRDIYKSDGSPLSVAEAVMLAGASQESTAGKETPLRQALSRARGMGITKDTELGQIVAPMALSPYTIDKFIKSNFGFFRKILELVPDYIRVQLTNVDDTTKPIAFDAISSVLVGRYLPVKFVQQGFGNDKEEEAIIGVLPSLVALQQGVDNGRIYPQYDLLDKLEIARAFMERYRWKSYGDALQDYKTKCEQQTSFLEPSPVCALNKLGVAFGLYLKRMVQSSDPTKGVSDINKYINKALEDDPNMVSMFGEPTPQEIEDKATKAFISLALPSKLGETLLQQNPSSGIMDTDRIIIEALPARFLSLEEGSDSEDDNSLFSIYQYKGDNRTKIDSYDDFLKTLVDLPQRIAFVYESPIGFYIRIVEYVGGASISKKNLKAIKENLEITAMNIENTLSYIGNIVVVSLAIFSINKTKGKMTNLYNTNLKFSNRIGLVDIQQKAKPFSDFLSRYISQEMISDIPQKKKPKTKSKTGKRFKNWTIIKADQNLYKNPVLLVFVKESELKKYTTRTDKTIKLNKVFNNQYDNLPKGDSLIQIVTIRTGQRRKVGGKYSYPELFQWVLINTEKSKLVSENTVFLPKLVGHDLNVIARTEINKIDKDIP